MTMISSLWRYFFLWCLSMDSLNAADFCFEENLHKDVSRTAAAAIVQRSTDSRQCLTHCATLKDTLPCRAAVYSVTNARSVIGVCQLYSERQKAKLVDVPEPVNNDATYYEIQDQCTEESQRISVDTAASPGPGQGGTEPGPTGTTTTTVNPIPPVIVVRPAPGGGGPNPAGPNGIITIQPGAIIDSTVASTLPTTTRPPGGSGGGGPTTPRPNGGPTGPFVPGPNGGPTGPFVPGPNGGPTGPFVPPTNGGGGGGTPPGQGGGGAVAPGTVPGVVPQPGGGGVYPKSAGRYQPSPGPGGYGGWAAWGQCTVTCGGGVMYRQRDCGATGCGSHDKQLKTCYSRKSCASWGPWSEWSPCSSAYGGGQQTRTRPCQGGYNCGGTSTDSRACATYQPQPKPYIPQPIYVAPRPAPQPESYYVAIHKQYYRNRNRGRG